jgi:hypothetical protein
MLIFIGTARVPFTWINSVTAETKGGSRIKMRPEFFVNYFPQTGRLVRLDCSITAESEITWKKVGTSK